MGKLRKDSTGFVLKIKPQAGRHYEKSPVPGHTKGLVATPPDSTSQSKPKMKKSKDEDIYTVEAILGKRKKNGRIEYHVKWLGFSE